MFDFLKSKRLKKCEETVKDMSDYLDATICFYQKVIDYNKELLSINDDELQTMATKNIELDSYGLSVLQDLRKRYDKIINSK